jgi:hypothetical protein
MKTGKKRDAPHVENAAPKRRVRGKQAHAVGDKVVVLVAGSWWPANIVSFKTDTEGEGGAEVLFNEVQSDANDNLEKKRYKVDSMMVLRRPNQNPNPIPNQGASVMAWDNFINAKDTGGKAYPRNSLMGQAQTEHRNHCWVNVSRVHS